MMDSQEWNKPLYRTATDTWNHDFFFKCMTVYYVPPSKLLLEQFERDFGSFIRFSLDFRKAGNAVYGSGWAWLVYDVLAEELLIRTTTGADNPMTINEFHRPVLAMDMWEHAYLQDFNSKKDYTKTFMNALVDWKFVEDQLVKVKMEAGTIREELERKRLEAETKAAARKEEIQRLVTHIAADTQQVELARIGAGDVVEAAKLEEKWLENQAAESIKANSEIKRRLWMVKDSRQDMSPFHRDNESELSDSEGHFLSTDSQSIVSERVGVTPLDFRTTVGPEPDISEMSMLSEERDLNRNLDLTNATLVSRVEQPGKESIPRIEKLQRVGLLSLFRGTKSDEASSGIEYTEGGGTRKASGILWYVWSSLVSRKTKAQDKAVDADVSTNESSVEATKVPAGAVNNTDGEGIITVEAPEKVSTPTAADSSKSKSHEESVVEIRGPPNPLMRILLFIWSIIRSFFRFLYYIWSLG